MAARAGATLGALLYYKEGCIGNAWVFLHAGTSTTTTVTQRQAWSTVRPPPALCRHARGRRCHAPTVSSASHAADSTAASSQPDRRWTG